MLRKTTIHEQIVGLWYQIKGDNLDAMYVSSNAKEASRVFEENKINDLRDIYLIMVIYLKLNCRNVERAILIKQSMDRKYSPKIADYIVELIAKGYTPTSAYNLAGAPSSDYIPPKDSLADTQQSVPVDNKTFASAGIGTSQRIEVEDKKPMIQRLIKFFKR